MAHLALKRLGQTLVPANRASALEIEKLPQNTILKGHVVRERSGPYHRMAFAFFAYVADALNQGPTNHEWDQDSVREHLLNVTGFTDIREMTRIERRRLSIPDAVAAYVAKPKSMSFDSMDQTEFADFMEAAFTYVQTELAPWIEDAESYPQILSIMGAVGPEEER